MGRNSSMFTKLFFFLYPFTYAVIRRDVHGQFLTELTYPRSQWLQGKVKSQGERRKERDDTYLLLLPQLISCYPQDRMLEIKGEDTSVDIQVRSECECEWMGGGGGISCLCCPAHDRKCPFWSWYCTLSFFSFFLLTFPLTRGILSFFFSFLLTFFWLSLLQEVPYGPPFFTLHPHGSIRYLFFSCISPPPLSILSIVPLQSFRMLYSHWAEQYFCFEDTWNSPLLNPP